MKGSDHPKPDGDHDTGFSMDASSVTFGPGVLSEAGSHARQLGLSRVALLTDERVAQLEHFEIVQRSLSAAGVEVAIYSDVACEPTDVSLQHAADFAVEADADGFLSLGGGSVIDTAKAANLFSTHPADLMEYVNAPIGRGVPPPGALRPHIACPTTSGTGSEATGIAVFDYLAMKAKTGIASRELRPTRALVDPNTTRTLPSAVVASTGFDVLSHAIESFTARPYLDRPAPGDRAARPMSQGANPWSDLGCREAIRLCGIYLRRAVADASDAEARSQMMWAATLAGIAFGNAGCHAPHGMSYSVSGLVRDYRVDGYPQGEPMVPHGFSVVVNAPSVVRATAPSSPARHLEAAAFIGADAGVSLEDAGDALAAAMIDLMRATAAPNGLGALGYTEADIPALVDGSFPQQRLLANAPIDISRESLADMYRTSMRYW